MKSKARLILTAVIVTLFLFPVTGFGQGTVNLEPLVSVDSEEAVRGKVKIEPMITVGSRMDTNFYKAETDEKDVYTYFVKPGFKLGYETPKSKISLKYTLNANYYDGDKDDYVGHSAILSGEIKPFARLTLGLKDSYSKTRDPGQADKFSNSVSREKYFVNRLNPTLLYEFGNKFSLGFGYMNTITDYDSSASEGSTEHKGILDLTYNFTPTTHIGLKYQHWKRDYDRLTSDYDSDELGLIFAKQFRRFSFEAGGGYHRRTFDNSIIDDINTFSYQLAASWKGANRSKFKFSVGQNFNDSGTGNSYFKETQFSLSAGRTFREKISTNIGAKYRVSDYETSNRKDNTYSISASLGYMLRKWLNFKIETGHEKRDSNFSGYDYDNTYIMGNIDVRYDPSIR